MVGRPYSIRIQPICRLPATAAGIILGLVLQLAALRRNSGARNLREQFQRAGRIPCALALSNPTGYGYLRLGTRIAVLKSVLILLGACLWLLLVVAICAIFAARGAADDRSEEWYAEQQRIKEAAKRQKRGAA